MVKMTTNIQNDSKFLQKFIKYFPRKEETFKSPLRLAENQDRSTVMCGG